MSQIGNNAFANITTLTSVEIYIAVEIEAIYDVFENSGMENGTINANVNAGCIYETTKQVEELFAGDNGPLSEIVVTGLQTQGNHSSVGFGLSSSLSAFVMLRESFLVGKEVFFTVFSLPEYPSPYDKGLFFIMIPPCVSMKKTCEIIIKRF